jgi:hypothetical protein
LLRLRQPTSTAVKGTDRSRRARAATVPALAQKSLPQQGHHKNDDANHHSERPRSIRFLRHIFFAVASALCRRDTGRSLSLANSDSRGRLSPRNPLRPSLGFQLHQQLLDAIFFFECGQTLFHVVGGDLGLGMAECFAMGHLIFHAVEGSGA